MCFFEIISSPKGTSNDLAGCRVRLASAKNAKRRLLGRDDLFLPELPCWEFAVKTHPPEIFIDYNRNPQKLDPLEVASVINNLSSYLELISIVLFK